MVGEEGFVAEGADFLWGVAALEGGEVDHAEGEIEAEDFRGFFNTTCAVFRDAFLDADGVDPADSLDQCGEGAGEFFFHRKTIG